MEENERYFLLWCFWLWESVAVVDLAMGSIGIGFLDNVG